VGGRWAAEQHRLDLGHADVGRVEVGDAVEAVHLLHEGDEGGQVRFGER
jgi:hypothetical protein